MKTQAWIWLTAGVVALGLNGFYQDGGAAWAHQVAERAASRVDYAIERISGRAEEILAKAQVATDRVEIARAETPACPLSSFPSARALAQVEHKMVRSQMAVAHFDAVSDREQAQLDRWEAQRERIQARVQSQIDARMNGQRARVRMISTGMEPLEIAPAEIRVACSRVRVDVPAVNIPEVSIPEISVPRISVPEVSVPEINVPRMRLPQIPAVKISAVRIPTIEIPAIRIPAIKIPAVKIPAIRITSSGDRSNHQSDDDESDSDRI